MHKEEKNKVKSKVIRWLCIVGGSISVSLGILGIFLPLLPTTPFLLLAASCYVRSSDKFYDWLINNKYLGKYIKSYREGKGIPLKAKIFSMSLLWLTILYSIIFVVNLIFFEIILFLIAVSVTVHIFSIQTLRQ